MINIVAFLIAAVIYFITWGVFQKSGLTSALIPALILISAAAISTYKPLVHKTIHGEEAGE
jgi:hypothetical protein